MQDKAILLDKAADIAIIFKIRRVSLEHLFFFSGAVYDGGANCTSFTSNKSIRGFKASVIFSVDLNLTQISQTALCGALISAGVTVIYNFC